MHATDFISAAESVKTSGYPNLSLVRDIPEFPKNESGNFELEQIPFALRESMDQMLKTLVHRASAKELEFVTDIDPDVPDHLVGDSLRLRQVITNLANNSIKFTEFGAVRISVSNEAECNGKRCLRFCVADTGIGIPADERTLICQAFEQVGGSTHRTHGGTGLGLAFAARLVEQMGGKIWLESEVRVGARFYFTARFGTPGSMPAGFASPAENQIAGVASPPA